MNVYFVYKVLTNRIQALIIAAGYIRLMPPHVMCVGGACIAHARHLHDG